MAKIIFFTAGAEPTAAEQAIIDDIAALTGQPFELSVRNSSEADHTNRETTDYVAKNDADLAAYPTGYEAETEFDPAAPPSDIGFGGDKALIYHGQAIAGTGGTFTVSIVDGVLGGTWA